MRWWWRRKTQACTVQYPERVDELATPIIVSDAYDPAATDVPPPRVERFDRAIWDTGATATVISERVVERLGLYPIREQEVETANGSRTAGVYLIALYLLNNVVFPALAVTDGKLGDDVDVLIGMDVIGSGDFAVTHADGRTCMSFQIPSRRRIHFKGGQTFTVAVAQPDGTPDNRNDR